MVQEYMEQFQKHYPHYNVEVKPKRDKRTGELRFAVLIMFKR